MNLLLKSQLWLLLALSFGCSTKLRISAEHRGEVERLLVSKEPNRYLRLSFYVTPFFGDSTKRLLTVLPPEEVDWIAHPDGKTVSPGAVETILPVGTRVRITHVEFPTAWALAERLVYTPRTHPWVFLEIEGQPKDVPIVLVLRPDGRDAQEVLNDVDQFLSLENPKLQLIQWPEPIQTAVTQKVALTDMPALALEMSWGFPERKNVSYDNGARKEEWIYPGKRRMANLVDGRVVKFQVTEKN